MPREARRDAPPPGPAGPDRRTVFGVPWPLPVSPWVVGLVLLLAVAAGASWFFEGRFETPPAEAAKRLLPYQVNEMEKVVLTSPSGSVTFTRDAAGKFSSGGPAPTPAPTPSPESAPGLVELPPSTKLEGSLGQLAELQVDRVVAQEPSHAADFGLDSPQMTIEVTPKRGGQAATASIAIGGKNPDGTAYYVRREGQPGRPGPRDTVLVTRFTLDDLMKVGNELITGQPSQSTG
jgi:Domain of unknown function (DUF4340)